MEPDPRHGRDTDTDTDAEDVAEAFNAGDVIDDPDDLDDDRPISPTSDSDAPAP